MCVCFYCLGWEEREKGGEREKKSCLFMTACSEWRGSNEVRERV